MTIESVEWMDNAICIGKLDIFFGAIDEKKSDKREREKLAVGICRACPVAYDCRLYARKNGELGVWGGETEEERFAGGYVTDAWVSRTVRARERRLLKKLESHGDNSVR